MAGIPKINIMGYVSSRVHFCRGGTLFHVQNGLGRLSFHRQQERAGEHGGKCQVWMGDELLIAPYIEPCPSYAGHLARGYGNGMVGNAGFMAASEAVNAAFEGIPHTVERIAPLLGLLPSGMYLAADFELFPTCSYDFYVQGGEKSSRRTPFFWDERDSREDVEEIKTIGWWPNGDTYEYDAPMFLAPSQRAAALNPERVEYYRKRLREEGDHFPRCIAVYLNGAYALLLDGHHKAAAAAAEGQRIRTIVLFSVDMKKREAESLPGSVRLYLLHSKGLRRPKGEDMRQQKTKGKHGEPLGGGLFLCDGQENIHARTFRLEEIPSTPLKPVDEGAMLPWGKIPKEYLQRLNQYPTGYELMEGTRIPPDKIKSAYEDFVALSIKEQDKRNAEYSVFEQKKELRERLFLYLKLFPESKWLSEAQIESLQHS